MKHIVIGNTAYHYPNGKFAANNLRVRKWYDYNRDKFMVDVWDGVANFGMGEFVCFIKDKAVFLVEFKPV